ncbi:head decoration protein [Ferrovibrio xuzhouensis]|uniref:Head decoration protein n=1 Tax=Ferrovibrio xuzhouensis TaxID=1576914 RepID=A0ABV7VB72_9PROT
MPTADGFTSQGTLVQENLFASDFPRIYRKLTLTGGAARRRGDMLGAITATGKLKLAAAAAGDGSEVPRFALAEDADASAADVECLVFVTGHFLPDALTFGAGLTADSSRDGLRTLGLHI